jgi:hypothetical protein
VKLVRYFSAYATWKPDAYARHRDYVAALKAQGVETNMAGFKKKSRSCFNCGARWLGHEEKETDVNIAVQMVADALTGEADRLILISADTDLAPPIRTIARLAPQCEVFVATPPKPFAPTGSSQRHADSHAPAKLHTATVSAFTRLRRSSHLEACQQGFQRSDLIAAGRGVLG